MEEEKKVIELKSISQFFEMKNKKQHVLEDINFSISSGEFVCIVGPSGCGKSTLLKIASGIAKPTSGNVKIGERKLAMVFQNFALFP